MYIQQAWVIFSHSLIQWVIICLESSKWKSMGLHVAPLSHKNPWRNKQAHKSGNPQLVLGERAIPRAPAFTPGLRELGPPRTIILYSSFLLLLPALAPIIPWPWTYGQALLLHRALLDISIFCSYQRKALRWPSSRPRSPNSRTVTPGHCCQATLCYVLVVLLRSVKSAAVYGVAVAGLVFWG